MFRKPTDIWHFPTKSAGVPAKIQLAKLKLLHEKLETGINSLYINLSLLLKASEKVQNHIRSIGWIKLNLFLDTDELKGKIQQQHSASPLWYYVTRVVRWEADRHFQVVPEMFDWMEPIASNTSRNIWGESSLLLLFLPLHWYKRELFNRTDSTTGLMGQTTSASNDNLEERMQILLGEVGAVVF